MRDEPFDSRMSELQTVKRDRIRPTNRYHNNYETPSDTHSIQNVSNLKT